MKALTVHQPWATLIAVGAKRYETRSRQTRHRGELAIHAGRAVDLPGDPAYRFVERALRRYGFGSLIALPRGQVLAIVRLVEVHPARHLRPRLSREQLAFGDFADGRFAWELTDVRPLQPGVPARGRLSLWEWDP